MGNNSASTHIAERDGLVHDLAVAQASFLVASLAPVISASIDRSLPIKKQREMYFGDLPEFTRKVIFAMHELASDADAMGNIVATGLKITEERAKSA